MGGDDGIDDDAIFTLAGIGVKAAGPILEDLEDQGKRTPDPSSFIRKAVKKHLANKRGAGEAVLRGAADTGRRKRDISPRVRKRCTDLNRRMFSDNTIDD